MHGKLIASLKNNINNARHYVEASYDDEEKKLG